MWRGWLMAVWVTNCARTRLMNFLLEVDGHMPVVVELQLHLREIYELKVGVLRFEMITSDLESRRRMRSIYFTRWPALQARRS